MSASLKAQLNDKSSPGRWPNPRSFNVLPPRSKDIQKVIDTHYTFVLFSCVFACTELRSVYPACSEPRRVNQNPRPSSLAHAASSLPLHFRHRDEKPFAATPLIPADCKCPLPQPLSLHILTNAPGGMGDNTSTSKVLLELSFCSQRTFSWYMPTIPILVHREARRRACPENARRAHPACPEPEESVCCEGSPESEEPTTENGQPARSWRQW